MTKELLFSVTASDCRWDYYKGTGAGGQKKNKTENCCRCTHIESGAVAYSEDGRSKDHNKRNAFRKMIETKEFQTWHRTETARRTGRYEEIDKVIGRAMQYENLRVEVYDAKQKKWIVSEER